MRELAKPKKQNKIYSEEISYIFSKKIRLEF